MNKKVSIEDKVLSFIMKLIDLECMIPETNLTEIQYIAKLTNDITFNDVELSQTDMIKCNNMYRKYKGE